MKAAVCYEFGKPLIIEEVTIDPPKKGEVKVKVAATAICHTDIHAIGGEMRRDLPMVAGHETSGYIEEVGEDVTGLKPGDPVVVSLVASCGKCYYCLQGLPHLCEYNWPLNTECRMHNQRGQDLLQLLKVGSFAEEIIVDQSQAVKIPQDMPMEQASLLGCGVITGFGAVVNRAAVKPFSRVVVIGTGGVGINSLQGAAFAGAHPIIAVDVLDAKLEMAKQFGATHTVNAGQSDAVEAVKKMTGGRGADFVFITVASIAAIKQGIAMCGARGLTVIVGVAAGKDNLLLTAGDFMRMERMLTGCFMGSFNLKLGIPRLIELYQSGRLKLDELVTARYPLERINDAIASTERGEVIRNVIVFNQ